MRLLKSWVYLICNSHPSFPWQQICEEENEAEEAREQFHQSKVNNTEKKVIRSHTSPMSHPGIQQFFFQWKLKKGCVYKNLESTLQVMCSASGLPPPQQAEGKPTTCAPYLKLSQQMRCVSSIEGSPDP